MDALLIIGKILLIVGTTGILISFLLNNKKYLFDSLVKSTRKSPNEYKRIINVPVNASEKDLALIKRNKDLLSLNGIPMNKIRFVFQPNFAYDIDKNKINPQYEVFVPLRTDGSGLFDKDAPVIAKGKPEKLIGVGVITYKVEDNFEFIKAIAKKSKRGVVVFITDDMTILNHKTEPYQFSVDSEYIRLINLDDAVEMYKDLPYESQVV